eukprot:COSAG04_NODE_31774_length_255_cov_0.589744_1_plen_55_part_01
MRLLSGQHGLGEGTLERCVRVAGRALREGNQKPKEGVDALTMCRLVQMCSRFLSQ